MKRKKSLKQKIAEYAYRRPTLEKKMATLENSMKEVLKLLNDPK